MTYPSEWTKWDREIRAIRPARNLRTLALCALISAGGMLALCAFLWAFVAHR